MRTAEPTIVEASTGRTSALNPQTWGWDDTPSSEPCQSLTPFVYEETIPVSHDDHILIFARRDHVPGVDPKVAWRIRSDSLVAMVQFWTGEQRDATLSDDTLVPAVPTLADVEVEPSVRGAGIALDTVQALGGRFGTIHSSGSYSKSGRGAFWSLPVGWLEDASGNRHDAPIYVSKEENYKFVNWAAGDFY